MRRLPPLHALQIFSTVARHRSFTRAAEQLCLTQGAVSRQIQTLEAHYGFPLFKRHAKGLTLTAEGEQLLPVVDESFSRIEDISMKLTRQRTDLALKVPTCVMRWMLPRIMRFQGEHPRVQEQGSDSHICGLRGCLGQGTLQLRAGSQHPPVFGIGCIISHLAGRAAKSFLPATRLHQDFGPGDEAGIFCRRSKSGYGATASIRVRSREPAF